ncbi:hypothetical protein C1645_732496 [Glomus cerebriforme]|uniref:Uncharacterized protein n=1 Tax=Glomus cerebriforme TaxID=658196 RepID=A0A397TH86_9GLOM|nr:hypothetical protein C1645_732496 [Glomus cerebriforme]
MSKILKKLFKSSNDSSESPAGWMLFSNCLIDEKTSNLDESSKSILRLWAKILREKHRKENYEDNEIFKDPLLLIEWNEPGITARTAVNSAFTKNALLTLIRAQAGYSLFPSRAPSDCAFAFTERQDLLNATVALVNNSWSRHINLVPDVGRCYEIGVPKKGKLEVDEHLAVFNA